MSATAGQPNDAYDLPYCCPDHRSAPVLGFRRDGRLAAEVEAVLASRDPEELSFTSAEVLQRVEERGDLFAPVVELQQELPVASSAS